MLLLYKWRLAHRLPRVPTTALSWFNALLMLTCVASTTGMFSLPLLLLGGTTGDNSAELCLAAGGWEWAVLLTQLPSGAGTAGRLPVCWGAKQLDGKLTLGLTMGLTLPLVSAGMLLWTA